MFNPVRVRLKSLPIEVSPELRAVLLDEVEMVQWADSLPTFYERLAARGFPEAALELKRMAEDVEAFCARSS